MFLLEAFDQITDFYDLFRIKSYCRFIKNDDFRISKDCLCKSYSLSVTFGQIFDQAISHI